jgi:hypothetical protein
MNFGRKGHFTVSFLVVREKCKFFRVGIVYTSDAREGKGLFEVGVLGRLELTKSLSENFFGIEALSFEMFICVRRGPSLSEFDWWIKSSALGSLLRLGWLVLLSLIKDPVLCTRRSEAIAELIAWLFAEGTDVFLLGNEVMFGSTLANRHEKGHSIL